LDDVSNLKLLIVLPPADKMPFNGLLFAAFDSVFEYSQCVVEEKKNYKMKLLILAILFVFGSANVVEEIDPYMTSNVFAIAGEFPSAVFIRAPGTPAQPTCGGTIIGKTANFITCLES